MRWIIYLFSSFGSKTGRDNEQTVISRKKRNRAKHSSRVTVWGGVQEGLCESGQSRPASVRNGVGANT